MIRVLIIACMLTGLRLPAQQVSGAVTVVSPNGVLKAKVELDVRGRLRYEVSCSRGGRPVVVVPWSDLGMVTKEADLSADLQYRGVVSERKVVDRYTMVHGKRRNCHNEAVEKVLRFESREGKLSEIVLRVYNDGVAFRYALPAAPAGGYRVTGERTSFTIPEGAERWMQSYNAAYEGLYVPATTGKGDAPDQRQWGFPALYRVKGSEVWALITEADLSRDNCASRLSNKVDQTVYRVMMPEEAIAAGRGWKSPWRVVMTGSLADIVGSTLVTDLSEPSTTGNTEWIQPGAAAWVYWAYNHGSKDYQKIVEYVDLANAMRWPYILIDWEWDRMGNGGGIEEAVAYAKSKGIRPLLWYNSRDSVHSSVGLDPYGRLSTHESRCKEFAWLNSIGVYGVKVDFFEDDRQQEVAYYLDLLADASKYHLMVDLHGSTVPRGWERTYPNLMTMEAVYGAEWYAYAPVLKDGGSQHNATLPFTRNVVGSMDYTPVTFTDASFPHTTTYAHELALSVVFESGLQHFADRPAGFYTLPGEVREFLMTVPVAWDDTRLIEGYPGKRVVIARRKGEMWYIGGINGEAQPQALKLSFDFLGKGMYEIEIIADGGSGKEFRNTKTTVKKGSKVEAPCLPRGGFVARIKPIEPVARAKAQDRGQGEGRKGLVAGERVIQVDCKQVAGRLSPMFNECVGAGRAAEGLRADWQQQLAYVRKECGFRYIRMHGLLTDEMAVYQEDKNGHPVYNFMYVDVLFDFLHSIGIKPFVELGFMPSGLASGSKTIFWWRGNVTPPKDYEKWGGLVRNLVEHFTERYGSEEVRSWYFEVWNEPNLDGFWAGTQQDYFRLYEYSAKAIKGVDTAYRVGGPATAGAAWEPEMIAYCHQHHVPLDFISTHAYGVRQGFLDEFGHAGTVLDKNPMSVSGDVLQSRLEIAQSAMPGLQLHYTEWSASYTPADPIHDSYHEAAYVLQKLKQSGNAANSMSYWVFTDIFEEPGPRFSPFHGGFGMLTIQGINKPVFYAYQFMHQLGNIELENKDTSSWVCKDPSGNIQALLWDFTITQPVDSVNNQDYYTRDLPARNKGKLTIKIDHAAAGSYALEIYKTGYHCNDAYSTYLSLGRPAQLNKQAVRQIKEQNAGAPVSREIVKIEEGVSFVKDLSLRENDVYLMKLIRL